MPIFTSLIKEEPFSSLSVLTVGNFDGVHKGHQVILNRVRELCHFYHYVPTVITFENHPTSLFKPNHIVPLLTTPDHKARLLEKEGIERIYMLEFDQNFANQSAEEFLTNVMRANPFRYLVLGYDAKIGKDRQGDGELIQKLAQKLHFTVEYLPPFQLDGEIVSSSLIRKCVLENDLLKAEKLLGRPFSIYSSITTGLGKGKRIGYPTLNFDLTSLCHPGCGVYAVSAILEKKKFQGIANLGYAPTIRNDHKLLLEVHLFDVNEDFYGRHAEIIFHELIRPERHFENVELLKKQISEDIVVAKKLHSL